MELQNSSAAFAFYAATETALPFLSCQDWWLFCTCKILRNIGKAAIGPTCKVVLKTSRGIASRPCTNCKEHWNRYQQAKEVSKAVHDFISYARRWPPKGTVGRSVVGHTESLATFLLERGFAPTAKQVVRLALAVERALTRGGTEIDAKVRAREVLHSFTLMVLLSVFVGTKDTMLANKNNYHDVMRCWRAGVALHEHLFAATE